ncbi:hypothetical protein Noda2021_08250 [Candidatus Dependentiae bacterium Noda2021]|nr:hypothetical protein Noda2021_08250 [Candidatus Dependentiae bacterium Noda2021]
MGFFKALVCSFLLTCQLIAMDPDYASPSREKITREIGNLDKVINTISKSEVKYFSGALVCFGILYYYPEQHTKELTVLYASESLLRSTIFVIGGNCARKFYDLRKKRLGCLQQKVQLETKLISLRATAITPEQARKDAPAIPAFKQKNKPKHRISQNLLAHKNRHHSMPAISPRNSAEHNNENS